jgi:uncharacterized protein DUF3108
MRALGTLAVLAVGLLPPHDRAAEPRVTGHEAQPRDASGLTRQASGVTAESRDTSRESLRIPFGVGERLEYDVRFGPLRVGEGTMEVLSVEAVRGRDAWHTRFHVQGGLPFYKVDDVLESWIDSAAFNSLRFIQDYDEGGRSRERRYEIYPERAAYQEGGKQEQQSIREPLDDGSFLYFVRTVPLDVGKTYEFNRYFLPDRNPVIVKVLRRERITVPAGSFDAIVIQPIIKTKGMFSEQGEAQIWLSDDARRMMLQLKSKTKVGSLNLYLKSQRPPINANH